MQITVQLGPRSYPIEIGPGRLESFDFGRFGASRYFIITDTTVKRLYGTQLLARLKQEGLAATLLAIPPGDGSKRLAVVERLCSQLAGHGADRSAVVLALGGGVVGDIAGFVASVYLRGIRHIQLPTSLLAQVDSAVGGKTGVNLPEGKNLVGTVYQPTAVVVDTSLLAGLPPRELRNGLAEAIKCSMVADAQLFDYLQAYSTRLGPQALEHIVATTCRFKAKVVSRDEYESEQRKVLNYGHTVGHAIEIASDHRVPHGEAVAIGMSYEARIAVLLGILSEEDLQEQQRLLQAIGLPTTTELSAAELIKLMRHDKKNQDGKLFFVLPAKIGNAYRKDGQVSFAVEEKIVAAALKATATGTI